jgi:hypothetical protein
MREGINTHPDMTVHNQRHAEESIHHGVRRIGQCERSTGGRDKGSTEKTLKRPVVASVWPVGLGEGERIVHATADDRAAGDVAHRGFGGCADAGGGTMAD